MFKKTKIAAATVALLGAAIAQNASAVVIDDTGSLAQVLVFPYYNTNNGFQTSVNIRNTKNETKAVKLRFRESKASNDVLDFNVYLSPYDHFSVTLQKIESSGAVLLKTTDTTCTYPTIPTDGVEFKNVYSNTSVADSREGYLEVIEMGVVDPAATVTINGSSKKIVDGIKHGITTGKAKPVDCSYVSTAWDTGVFTQGGAKADARYVNIDSSKVTNGYYSDEGGANDGLPNAIFTPTGGLQGYSILLNVAAGAAFVGDPVAIRHYQTTVTLNARNGGQHYKSDDQAFYLLPSLASGNVHTVEGITSSSAVVPAGYSHTWSDVVADWGLSDPNVAPNTAVPSGINPFPIADVLAATGLHNDYFINPTYQAATDWVVTLPMKKHGIFNGYRFDGLVKSTDSSHPVNAFKANSGSTVDVSFSSKFYDREEQVPVQSVGFSPAVQGQIGVLDREVNILTFTNTDNATSPVLGTDSPKKFSIQSGFVEGWAQLTFTSVDLTALAGSKAAASGTLITTTPALVLDTTPWSAAAPAGVTGVPALGFAAIRANFSGKTGDVVGETTRHVFTRSK